MTTTPPPAAWVEPWPEGRAKPEAPGAAIWIADLVIRLNATGASLGDIATATNLDIRTVRAVTEGRRWPTLHTAVALAVHLADRRSTAHGGTNHHHRLATSPEASPD